MAGKYDREKFDEALRRQYDEMLAQDDKYMEDVSARVYARLERGELASPIDRFAHRSHRTNEERLAYYRAHGLNRCNDYPGGDAAFEADVLSGVYHDEDGVMKDLPREDAYVVARMEDGRFTFTREFTKYGYNRTVFRAVLDNCHKNGFALR